MRSSDAKRFESLYKQHISALKRQGKSPRTIDSYGRAVRQIATYFDCCPDRLTREQLEAYFTDLVENRSWNTVKIQRNGLQFFYKHVLKKQWQWVDIVKPRVEKPLPDILSPEEISIVLRRTLELRYQCYFYVVYSLGLRLEEARNLEIGDIDSARMKVHVHLSKYYKDRFVTLPTPTLHAMRHYWSTHRNPRFIFPAGNTVDKRYKAVRPMSRSCLQTAFKVVVAQCGIHKNVSIHSLRHCYGTHLMDEGLHLRAIQDEMGHACPKTTALYTRLTQQRAQDRAAIIDRMVKRVDYLPALGEKK